MIALLILAAVIYGIYRGVKRWSVAFICFLSAAVSLLGATGVVTERLWGPQWSWNFAHHGPGYAWQALAQTVLWAG